MSTLRLAANIFWYSSLLSLADAPPSPSSFSLVRFRCAASTSIAERAVMKRSIWGRHAAGMLACMACMRRATDTAAATLFTFLPGVLFAPKLSLTLLLVPRGLSGARRPGVVDWLMSG